MAAVTICSDFGAQKWNSPGQNTAVDSLSLLQGIFPTQGLNAGLSDDTALMAESEEELKILLMKVK